MTTIIKPQQNSHKTTFLTIFLITCLLLLGFYGIFLYNKIVNLQHLVKYQKNFSEKAKLTNADLKNQIYQVIDSKKLIDLANKLGLISVKNPDFVQLESPLASR